MDLAALHALLAYGSVTSALVIFGVDLYAWYTGPVYQAFSLTCLDDLLRPLLNRLDLGRDIAQAALALTHAIPLSLFLLGMAWLSWHMALYAAEEVERAREEWRQYLPREPRR